MIIPKRKIRYPIAIEREYAKLLVAYVKAEFKIVESFIPEMTDALIRNAIKQDDTDDYEESLTEKMLKVAGLLVVFDKMRKKLQKISPTKIIDKIFGRVNKHVEREHSETIKSVFGSEPRVEKNNRQFEMLKTVWTAENMTLIKSIDSQTMDKIRFTLSQKIIATANREMLMSDLTKDIRQLAGVSETRAALIGADQVGKLNGRLTQYRQMSAGIESYIWRTMGDRRVRPNHAARSGLVFKWSNPPDGGHPGQAVRCRCVAQPLIDEQSFKLVPQKNSYTNYEESGKIQVPKGLAAGNIPYVNQSGTPPKLIGYTPDIREDTVRRTLERYEKIIVKSKVENAIIITRDREIYHCSGDLNGLPSIEELGNKLTGAFVTHNHPVGSATDGTFSHADFGLFKDKKLSVLRGIEDKYMYELNRNPKITDLKGDVSFERIDKLNKEQNADYHSAISLKALTEGFGYRRWLR